MIPFNERWTPALAATYLSGEAHRIGAGNNTMLIMCILYGGSNLPYQIREHIFDAIRLTDLSVGDDYLLSPTDVIRWAIQKEIPICEECQAWYEGRYSSQAPRRLAVVELEPHLSDGLTMNSRDLSELLAGLIVPARGNTKPPMDYWSIYNFVTNSIPLAKEFQKACCIAENPFLFSTIKVIEWFDARERCVGDIWEKLLHKQGLNAVLRAEVKNRINKIK